MSISSNSIRRHLLAASCPLVCAATAYVTSGVEEPNRNHHHFSVSVAPAASSALTSASKDAAFWVSTSMLQDPFVRTTLAEPSGLKAKKKLTKAMTLQEKWEYFTLKAINPGDDDDDDDEDEDEDEDEEEEEDEE